MAIGNLGKYSAMLQNMPNPNTGTHAGGLSHVLQQALLGYSAGQDQRAEEATQGRLTQMLKAMTGTPDNTITWNQPTRLDGTGDPTTLIPGKAPDLMGAINIGAEDPALQELTLGLLNQQNQGIAAANELIQVPNPNGDGSMIYARRGDVGTGDMAESAPAFTPDIESIIDGNMEKQGYFDQNGNWVPMGSGNRWEPTTPAAPKIANIIFPDGAAALVNLNDPAAVADAQARGGVLGDPEAGGGSPFDGSAKDIQLINALRTLDPNSQDYAIAYSILGAPKYSYNPTTNERTNITQDMSMFSEPTFVLPPETVQTLTMPTDASTETDVTTDRSGGIEVTKPDTLIPADQRAYNAGITVIDRVGAALTAYKDRLMPNGELLSKFELLNPTSPGAVAVAAARTDLMMELKELFDLGVLTGPDMGLLEDMTANPTTFFSKGLLLGSEGFGAQFDVMADKLVAARSILDDEYGQGAPVEYEFINGSLVVKE